MGFVTWKLEGLTPVLQAPAEGGHRLHLWILDEGSALEHDAVGTLACRELAPGHAPWRTFKDGAQHKAMRAIASQRCFACRQVMIVVQARDRTGLASSLRCASSIYEFTLLPAATVATAWLMLMPLIPAMIAGAPRALTVPL